MSRYLVVPFILAIGVSMSRYLLIPFIALAIVSSSLAQNGPDIMRILEYFVVSKAAASKCIPANEEADNKFSANFMMVSIRAAQSLKQRNPNTPEAELTKAISERVGALTKGVESDIEKNGCESASAKQLVKLYKVNVEWKP